ncbi:MAG: N-acetylmuramoyl-L-alanine amidase [Anaerolineae bacterium]|nr:N-acetylmuramoyl-L-alanine amidase [Anaerolineae bacterium]
MASISWTIDIDLSVYERALERARLEGQDLSKVVQRLLRRWIDAPAVAYEEVLVRPGDTIAGIAARVYGEAQLAPILAAYNRLVDPSLLAPGQRLRVPVRADLARALQPPDDTSPSTVHFVPSPNHNERPSGVRVWAIVVHATGNETLAGAVQWFANPASSASAHYVIGKDGRVVQMVREDSRAWHAGPSTWQGVPVVNDYAIGVTLVNRNDGRDPYPDEQYRACLGLSRQLVAKYGIAAADVVGHCEVATDGRTDPLGFALDRLRRDVAA